MTVTADCLEVFSFSVMRFHVILFCIICLSSEMECLPPPQAFLRLGGEHVTSEKCEPGDKREMLEGYDGSERGSPPITPFVPAFLNN